MDNKIVVDSGYIKEIKDSLNNYLNMIIKSYDELLGNISSIDRCLFCSNVKLVKSKVTDHRIYINESLKNLCVHIDKLDTIAMDYEKTEKGNEDVIEYIN